MQHQLRLQRVQIGNEPVFKYHSHQLTEPREEMEGTHIKARKLFSMHGEGRSPPQIEARIYYTRIQDAGCAKKPLRQSRIKQLKWTCNITTKCTGTSVPRLDWKLQSHTSKGAGESLCQDPVRLIQVNQPDPVVVDKVVPAVPWNILLDLCLQECSAMNS